MTAPMDEPILEVLVVEDDEPLRAVLVHHLSALGWRVRGVGDGPAALDACAQRQPDVVVLDVMLPGASGIEVCTQLRALYDPSPGVLMLTARDAEADVILGFDSGADDYVVKPCRPKEVIARLRALGRRVRHPSRAPEPPVPDAGAPVPSSPDKAPLVHGALKIDEGKRRVTVGANALRLTPTEFELLHHMARVPERAFSRMDLLQEVWGSSHAGYARNVDCHVTRLRRKIEAAGLVPAPIETVHGMGYRFVTPGSP
jgi:DNA-binding response OmpR family regulator